MSDYTKRIQQDETSVRRKEVGDRGAVSFVKSGAILGRQCDRFGDECGTTKFYEDADGAAT